MEAADIEVRPAAARGGQPVAASIARGIEGRSLRECDYAIGRVVAFAVIAVQPAVIAVSVILVIAFVGA